MRRSEALSRLAGETDAIRAFGVTALHLFGSTATDDASPSSDIDLFVDHDSSGKFSLFDLVGVKLLVEERLGVRADVATRDGLHPILCDRIEVSAIRVF